MKIKKQEGIRHQSMQRRKEQPLVFISHVADCDKDIAASFEDWIRIATQSGADVFVSSTDGIPPGEFADRKIIQKLQEAQVLIILLSPSAKNNSWLAFESGAFYGLKKPVIPIACRGAKPSDFDGPLKQPQMTDASDKNQFSKAMATLGKAIGIHFVREYAELRNELCTQSGNIDETNAVSEPNGQHATGYPHGGGVLAPKEELGGVCPDLEHDPHVMPYIPHDKLANRISDDGDDNSISRD